MPTTLQISGQASAGAGLRRSHFWTNRCTRASGKRPHYPGSLTTPNVVVIIHEHHIITVYHGHSFSISSSTSPPAHSTRSSLLAEAAPTNMASIATAASATITTKHQHSLRQYCLTDVKPPHHHCSHRHRNEECIFSIINHIHQQHHLPYRDHGHDPHHCRHQHRTHHHNNRHDAQPAALPTACSTSSCSMTCSRLWLVVSGERHAKTYCSSQKHQELENSRHVRTGEGS